jgi:hypothetical protein
VYKTSSLAQKLQDGVSDEKRRRRGVRGEVVKDRCAGLWWRRWINLVVVVIVTGRALEVPGAPLINGD